MYTYQKQYIYDPVLGELTSQQNDKMKMLALATSAGKTHTLTRHVIPDAMSQGLADIVIFTTPNPASMGEVSDALKESVPAGVEVVCEPAFAGGNVPIQLALAPTVIVCHPTWVSTNKKVLAQLAGAKNIVGFCDEAHIGFQASNEEEAVTAYGRSCTYYPAEWNNAVQGIPYKAWFLVTATPRNTVEGSDYMEILSECFELDILANMQKRVREVIFNPGLVDCDYANSLYDDETSIIERLTQKYDLPTVKRAAIFQGKNTAGCVDIWYAVGKSSPTFSTAIAISDRKRVYGANGPVSAIVLGEDRDVTLNSTMIVNGVNDPDTPVDRIVANNNVNNAVNISGATMLYSEKDNKSIRDITVTQGVEQLLGRMLRWPNVEGLNSWEDVAVFRQEKIEAGVPETDIDEWIDLVFGYTVILPDSPVNVAGVKAFFKKHTFDKDGWDTFVQNKYQLAREGKLQSKSRSLGHKSPWSQPGDLKYRLEKGEYCEECPPIPGVGSDLPACAWIHFELKGLSKGGYLESLDVHHEGGDHLNGEPTTHCANHHRAVTHEEGHAVNVKYRGTN